MCIEKNRLLAFENFGSVPYLPLKRNVYNGYRITLPDNLRDQIMNMFYQLKNKDNLVHKENFTAQLLATPLIDQNIYQVIRKKTAVYFCKIFICGFNPPVFFFICN